MPWQWFAGVCIAEAAISYAPGELILERICPCHLSCQARPVPGVVSVGARCGALQRGDALRGELELAAGEDVRALALVARLQLCREHAMLDA